MQEQLETFDAIFNAYMKFFKEPFTEMPVLSTEFQRKDALLRPILSALTEDDEDAAIAAFGTLPVDDQRKIYGLTWEFKQYPSGIHDDFGNMSFHRNATIPAEWHCSKEDRLNILHLYLHQ